MNGIKKSNFAQSNKLVNQVIESSFKERNLSEFANAEEAYYQLMIDLVEQQALSNLFKPF